LQRTLDNQPPPRDILCRRIRCIFAAFYVEISAEAIAMNS
jgi:hypothetical protein